MSKRFYVFVGANNSGKTYVSQLLWTIFDFKILARFINQIKEKEIPIELDKDIEITKDIVSKLLEKFAHFIEREVVDIYNITKKSSFSKTIRISFDFSLDELQEYDLEKNFTLDLGAEEQSPEYISVTKKTGSLKLKLKEKQLPQYVLDLLPEKQWIQEKSRVDLIIRQVLMSSIILILLKHQHQTFFLPASRSFYPIFYRYIYDIERKDRDKAIGKILDLFEKNKQDITKMDDEYLRKHGIFKRQYTEPMNRAIEAIYSLNTNPEEVFHYKNLVENLAKIMGGDILMKSLEGIAPIEFFFKPDKQEIDLPMYLASSAVNQLSLLYLYFKYWVAEENNFLMMDEPEENLHPENQILLLELLLDFANQNENRVLITTHSPLLANALNNYIYLNILKNKHNCDLDDIIEEHKLKYLNSSTSIARDDVGVYFFDGKEIIEYDSGYYSIYFRDFQGISSAIERSAETLTDYIYYMERDEDEGDEDG